MFTLPLPPRARHRTARDPLRPGSASELDDVRATRRGIRVDVVTERDDLVVVKSASRPEGVDALHREALVLCQLRHPNVVDLVRSERADDHASIVTHYAGRTSLAEITTTDPATIAGLAASLLTVLDDVHTLGWTHGRIRPEHCIVDAGGRLTLCGFGAARRVSPDDDRVAVDVAAAIAVISGVADRADRSDPSTDRATRRRHRALRRHLDRAHAGDPVSVEQLRSRLARLAGTAALPRRPVELTTRPTRSVRPSVREAPTRPTRRVGAADPRRGALVGTAATTVLLVGVVAFLRWVGGPLGESPPAGVDGHAVTRIGELPLPVVVALSMIRVVAFAACLYGIVLSSATFAAVLTRRRDIERLATRLAPPRLRRTLVALIGAGVIAGSAGAPATPAPSAPTTTTTTAPSTTSAATTTTTTTTTAPTTTTTAPPLPAADAAPAPVAAPPSAPEPTDRWVIAPGDHLWSIADTVLSRHLGRHADADEIDGYWRRLIELNRATLLAPHDPDLVYTGQIVELPPLD